MKHARLLSRKWISPVCFKSLVSTKTQHTHTNAPTHTQTSIRLSSLFHFTLLFFLSLSLTFSFIPNCTILYLPLSLCDIAGITYRTDSMKVGTWITHASPNIFNPLLAPTHSHSLLSSVCPSCFYKTHFLLWQDLSPPTVKYWDNFGNFHRYYEKLHLKIKCF